MRSPRAECALVAIFFVAACAAPQADEGDSSSSDEGPPPEPRQLVVAEGWIPAPAERDVFIADKPGAVECPPVDGYDAVDFGGYPAFEIHTEFCDYLTVEQPLGDDVFEGETINVRMWHFDLIAAEPAVGHAGVSIEGEVMWTYEVDIPSEGALASSGWVTDHDLPAGTWVQFHVHNHGVNSWNLIEITAEPG